MHKFFTLFAIAVMLFISSCSGCSAKYVAQVGAGQAKILLKRQPVEKFINNPQTPQKVRDKLKFILEVKGYGEEKVGLKKTGAYTSYVRLDSEVVAWNLMASPKLELKPVTWWFPIVGRVPYLGYFKYKQGREKEEELKRKGYDTYLRGAGAYSTLGWFDDPVFSPLLNYSDAVLANIILHEMTHTTVFIEGHVAYNEGMATFVGNQASLDFLAQKFGAKSKEVQEIRDYIHNDKVFSDFIRELVEELNELYQSDLNPEEKMKRREEIFDNAMEKFKNLPLRGSAYRSFSREKLNNAALLSRAIYLVDLEMYEELYKVLGNNLPKCLEFFLELEKKVKRKEVSDPEKYTKEFIAGRRGNAQN